MVSEPSQRVDPPVEHRRWQLIRDALYFQGKLFLDGFMDLVLAPVGLAAALVGLLGRGDRAEGLFYRVLQYGHRFDRWINLFGARRRLTAGDASAPEDPEARSTTVDAQLERVERLLVDSANRGGVTHNARKTIDRILDSLQIDGGPPESP